MNRWGHTICAGLMVGFWLTATGLLQAQQYKPADLLAFKPKQPHVDYETPAADQVAKCKVERDAKYLTLSGPEGQILRRFGDLDGDKEHKVDVWSYYDHGLEVYREIDTNGNGKADQYRWLNLGGSRWGVDDHEDGVIDRWKSLSAAEASREAIVAMTTGDLAALQRVMITADDLKTLGMNAASAAKILESVGGIGAKASAVLKKSKLLTSRTKWVRLEVQMPSAIPADDGKATQDLQIYEAAMAIVEQPGGKDPVTGLVQLGEMIRIGEVWKLTQVPQPIEGNDAITSSGLLMQPLLAGTVPDIAAPSPAMQKLIEELQKLDENPPALDTAKPAELANYNNKRADLLIKAVSLTQNADEQIQFLKQCVDGLAAAVQTGAFPAGMKRIEKIEEDIAKTAPKSPVLPYIVYRRITSQYAVDMQAAVQENQPKVQKAWLDSLAQFVKDYPDAEDTPDAMWQLATAEEFATNQASAIKWYQQLAKDKKGTLPADKAQGALRRIGLTGKPFVLNGPSLNGGAINTATYRGKVLLVVYWATWSKLFTDDLSQLRALHQQYRGKGFEVLGVCLDLPGGTPQQQTAQLQKYLKDSNIPWPQIYEPGGLDSSPAVQYGIVALPTYILIDKDGEVLSRQSSVQELKDLLPKQFK